MRSLNYRPLLVELGANWRGDFYRQIAPPELSVLMALFAISRRLLTEPMAY